MTLAARFRPGRGGPAENSGLKDGLRAARSDMRNYRLEQSRQRIRQLRTGYEAQRLSRKRPYRGRFCEDPPRNAATIADADASEPPAPHPFKAVVQQDRHRHEASERQDSCNSLQSEGKGATTTQCMALEWWVGSPAMDVSSIDEALDRLADSLSEAREAAQMLREGDITAVGDLNDVIDAMALEIAELKSRTSGGIG